MLKKIMGYSLSSIINGIISLLVSMVMTRIFIPEEYGLINYFSTGANLVMGIACMGMDAAYIRFYYESPDKNEKKLAESCLLIPIVVILLFTSLVILNKQCNSFVSAILGVQNEGIALALIVNAFSLLVMRFLNINYRMQGRVKSFVVQSVIITLLSKGSFIVVSILNNSITCIIYVSTIILFISAVLFLAVQWKRFICLRKIQLSRYIEVYKFAFFEAPFYLILYLEAFFPQYLIKRYLDENILGIYGAIMLFSTAFQMASTGFATFWSPYVYKNYKTYKQVINDVQEIILFLCTVFICLLPMLNKVLFLILGMNYRSNQNLLCYFLFPALFSLLSETTVYGISISKKNYFSFILKIVSFVFFVISSFLLVNSIGLTGIAISVALSSLFLFISQTIIGQKYYRTIRNKNKFVLQILFINIVSLCYFYFYNTSFIYLFCSFVVLIIEVLMNINKLKLFITKLVKTKNNNINM